MTLLTLILILITSILSAPPFRGLYILRTTEECNMLTWSNIDCELLRIGIRETEIVKAQIKHETGNLTSRFCREQNNLLGMRLAHTRETTAIGEGNHMAIYRSWQESLLDYKIWQDKYYSGGDYFRFLYQHNYADDPFYVIKLKRNL